MKTETILGTEVIRVDGGTDSCYAKTVAGLEHISCAFHHRNCQLPDGQMACGDTPDIFIRPDQLQEFLAIKLVS